jgi:hypothetical protein
MISELTAARIARRAAVCAEFLALKARRCLEEQTAENAGISSAAEASVAVVAEDGEP